MDITKEQFAERYDALPSNIREHILSEGVSEKISKIAAAYNLDDKGARGVSAAVGAMALGFVEPGDLGEEIVSRTGVSRDTATSIATALGRDVLAPILLEIKKLYGYDEPAPATRPQVEPQKQPAAQPQQTTQTAPVRDFVRMRPPQTRAKVDAAPPAHEPPKNEAPPPAPPPPPPTTTTPDEPASAPIPKEKKLEEKLAPPPSPYLMHKSEGVERAKSTAGDETLMRPYFFEPAGGSQQEPPGPVTARLEIGSEPQKRKKKRKGRAGKETIKVVNYSGPSTQADPFGKKQSKQKENIPPDNVVDLKDLPQ